MKKVAFITGAAGGIGFSTVEKFAKEGYSVVAMDVVPEENVKEKFEGLDEVTYISGNLASAEDRERAVKAALAKFSRIDVLVNVAGVAPKVRNDILEMTEESYDFVMGIVGPFFAKL